MFLIFTKIDVFDCLHDNSGATVARNAPASWPAATPQDVNLKNVDLYLSSMHEQ
jgi:hypothetical protein